MRLLALTLKPPGLSPGQRFRLEQWASHLHAHAIAVEFRPYESARLTELLYRRGHVLPKTAWVLVDFLRRARTVASVRAFDAVVVYREAALIGPAIFERLLARSGVPMLFDFDDAIWEPQLSPINTIFSRLHFWGKTATTCRLAGAVTVGNAYLAAYAAQHNDCVHVVPTSIDLAVYPVRPEASPDQPFTVCWTGSITTLPLLELARPALERLAQSLPLRVKVICNTPPERPIVGAENVFVQWREDGEPAEIADCHVGIMPLPDDSYMKGKCGLKALQFMATGRPVVISPVGMNVQLIRHGENGFLAATEDEWVAALLRLARSAGLRAQIGLAGRRTVETGYSAPQAAARFAAAVRSAVDQRAGTSAAAPMPAALIATR